MKIREKLFFFLALNTLGSVLFSETVNLEKLYDNIEKNLNKEKSNEKLYKLIEKILSKKNKELKDLYLQNDYIIKPEFLEWQVFFTGFYDHSNRGGSKKERVKTYEATEKKIELDTILTIKAKDREDFVLNINPPQSPNINISSSEIIIPQVNEPSFDIEPITFPEIFTLRPTLTNSFTGEGFIEIGKNTQNIQFSSSGTTAYENLNMTALEKIKLQVNPGLSLEVTGATSYNNGLVSGTTVSSYTHGVIPKDFTFINISLNGDYMIKGDWEYYSPDNVSNLGELGFLSYRPYYVTSDSRVDFLGNLELTGFNSPRQKVGFYLNLQNQASLPDVTATLEINGIISATELSTTALQISPYNKVGSVSGELINSGTINLQTTGTFNYHATGIQVLMPYGESGNAVVKIGNINANGKYDDAVYIRSALYGNTSYETGSNVILDGSNGLITLNGERNIGVTISRFMGPLGGINGLENIKNLNILVNGLNGVGINVSPTELNFANDYVLTDKMVESIKFGENSKSSTLFTGTINKSDKYLVLDESLKNAIGVIDTGTMNAVVSIVSSGRIINNIPIEISSNAKATSALTTASIIPYGYYDNGMIINNADIINNSSSYIDAGVTYGGLGIGGLSNGVVIINNGNIDMNGESAIALYNQGETESKSDHIILNGNKGIAVFGNYGVVSSATDYVLSTTKVSANKLEVNGENSIVLYSKGGDIELSPLVLGGSLEITANGKNTYTFYHETATKKTNPTVGKFIINGDVNVNLKNGASGFIYKGTGGGVNLTAYIDSIVDSSNGNLNIISDENSYKVSMDNVNINLSDLLDLNTSNITFTGNGKVKLYKGDITIDNDSDLDKNNLNGDKTYRDMEIGLSHITVENGVNITGTEESLIGILQSAQSGERYVNIINNGVINLTGASSFGMYNKRGSSKNTGQIDVEGLKSIGMFTVSGVTENYGEIKIKNSGIGIYNTTYLNSSDNPSLSSSSSVTNYGKIISNNGLNSVGIFANNNPTYGTLNMSLTETSIIDLSSSENGVGIYGNNANITAIKSGEISVGDNSIGIYGKDSIINLDDLNLNLVGDGAVGLYIDGTTNFNGSGNINIDGKGITVFNIVGSGIFNQNFNISSTADSSYTLQNLLNRTSYYNSTASLGKGGVFISGENSAVLLDGNSKLISQNSNLVALALNGSYVGLNNINGILVDYEATNKGIISFGDNSVGLYVKNGASAINEGDINLTDNSVGLYGNGLETSISNTGIINIGDNSVGLYLYNGKKLINEGNISSIGNKSVGLYLEGENTSEIANTGDINLFGQSSVGIYNFGAQLQTINNNGNITIGDSDSNGNFGVGIYNNNNSGIVNNYGNITTGENAAGIYTNGGVVNHFSGDIEIGSNAVGVYAESGSVNLTNGKLKATNIEEIGIYAKKNTFIDNNLELYIGRNSYGVILESNSDIINRNKSVLEGESILLYSNGENNILNEINADIEMLESNSIAFYMENGGTLVNKASIIGNTGISNIGIYVKNGSVDNSGDIILSDSLILDENDPSKNFYSVAVYGENTLDMKNTGKLEIGSDGIGLYASKSINEVLNTGDIVSNSNGAVGIYAVKSTVNNTGNINLLGDKSIGIAATMGSIIKNSGIITMNGNESVGIYSSMNSHIINETTGVIYINGNNSTGIQLEGNSILENYGEIEVKSGTIGSVEIANGTTGTELPSIINAGVIKVDGKFDLEGLNLIIKPDPETFRIPTIEEITTNEYYLDDLNSGFLLTNSVQIAAPSFDFGTDAVKIDPLFTQGTNARVYKFENVFDPLEAEGSLNDSELTLESGSLTFKAIPNINSSGKVDIWMEKVDYSEFTNGLWYDSFAHNIESKYLNATGDALKIYDKIDLINDAESLESDFNQLAGSMYANINQREDNITRVFKNALDILQDSHNNTKENVKINIIAGKGRSKESTSGVDSYDYESVGIIALREVERTYKHKFGYSLGYTRTDFEMNNTNNEDRTDTVQLGLHNKYGSDGWYIKNDLLGKVSFHNVERNIDWSDGTKSELSSNYNAYGVNLFNELGKDLSLGKNSKITPYIGLELGYAVHSDFSEKGDIERLKIKSNDSYTIKPNVGIKLEGEKKISNSSDWKLKGSMGVSYEYELGNTNKQEKASLTLIEDDYHKLAKVSEDEGKVKVNTSVGVEIEDRYGVFLTGEYKVGDNDKEDYRVGISLKAVF